MGYNASDFNYLVKALKDPQKKATIKEGLEFFKLVNDAGKGASVDEEFMRLLSDAASNDLQRVVNDCIENERKNDPANAFSGHTFGEGTGFNDFINDLPGDLIGDDGSKNHGK